MIEEFFVIHVQVVEALALVVSALPAEQRKAGLKALLSPVVAALRGCLEQELRPDLTSNGHAINGSAGRPAQSTAAGLDHTLPLVDRMTIIFRCACNSLPNISCTPFTKRLCCNSSSHVRANACGL